ncbi:OLC1v1008034C1 [Oldenlandia corymbosa var. corymbosa]|uniref:OLC1v1008034C1 n=1 Tax=Oldenlandia corymbosa var. corymbosa TaxID=529605 RepID=A0AAV1DN63_OLDCO|nr:OLC1v1008034C1 [Oldenlandia corymbosa var. corymbosa]
MAKGCVSVKFINVILILCLLAISYGMVPKAEAIRPTPRKLSIWDDLSNVVNAVTCKLLPAAGCF